MSQQPAGKVRVDTNRINSTQYNATHEIGHYLHMRMTPVERRALERVVSRNLIGPELTGFSFAQNVGAGISTYATKSNLETIAEGFTEYILSPNPSPHRSDDWRLFGQPDEALTV